MRFWAASKLRDGIIFTKEQCGLTGKPWLGLKVVGNRAKVIPQTLREIRHPTTLPRLEGNPK
jgi:hypothetical protein